MRSAGRRVRQSCCSHMTDYRGAAKNHVYKELTTRGNAPDRKASDSVAATLADRQSTPMTAQESGGRTRGCAQKGRPSGEGDALQAAVGGARKCSGAPPPPPRLRHIRHHSARLGPPRGLRAVPTVPSPAPAQTLRDTPPAGLVRGQRRPRHPSGAGLQDTRHSDTETAVLRVCVCTGSLERGRGSALPVKTTSLPGRRVSQRERKNPENASS